MRNFFLLIFFVLIATSNTFSQDNLNAAEEYFRKKYEIIDGRKADSHNIDQAIRLFKESGSEPDKSIGLLKSYEFKASWTKVSEEEKRALYEKAVELAKSKTSEFPRNGAIAYWHVANYARWADLIDITEAAQEGVIDEIKKLAERAIELDETYNQAGALRLLGGLHLEAPNIPLILTWPSDKEAEHLLKKAYNLAPEHPANVYLYAKVLHTRDNSEKAKKIFKDLINRDPRREYLLVDKKYIQKGVSYLEENY